jgi:IclR family transcriptional regulator, acetate operon repressor
MTAEATGSQAVDRAAELLVRIMESERPPSVSELAAAASLPKSTTSRLLRALEGRGLVQRDGARGSLRPGSVLLRYARRAGRGGDLVELAGAALDELAELTGETVNVAVAGPAGVEHLAQRDSRFFLGSANWIGRPVPFHAAANGKVFLAFGSAKLPRGPLAPLTESTVVDRAVLELELAAVRERGWATAVEELEPGLLAIAAPVRDAHGDVIAALSVSAPTVRLPADRLTALGPLVAAAAARVPTGA